MKLPTRKPTRLKGYDYSTNGAYFVTICTKDKQKLLCDIVGEGLCALPSVKLTPIGIEVQNAIEHISKKHTDITIDKYVIMPNHIHLLVQIRLPAGGHGDPPLHTVIGEFKSFTTHIYGKQLWQRSFHDHIIRKEADYLKIWQYIDTNPQKWEEDCFFVIG